MARCAHCGTESRKTIQITSADGKSHIFDSFECAIHVLAPTCNHCGCRIIGHGIEADEKYFCCAHCARSVGVAAIVDHA